VDLATLILSAAALAISLVALYVASLRLLATAKTPRETPIGGLAADGPYSAELKRQWGMQGNHEGEAAGLLDAYLTAERERAEERARVLVA
jgi:hypothetical protein